jgi:hypothetical protein
VNLAKLWWFITLMKLKSVAFAKFSCDFASIQTSAYMFSWFLEILAFIFMYVIIVYFEFRLLLR